MIPSWQANCQYKRADLQLLQENPKQYHEFIAIDIETTGLDFSTDHIVGISYSYKEGEAFYIPIAHKGEENVPLPSALDYLRRLTVNATCVFYNAKFDVRFLRQSGFEPAKWLDTQVMLYLVELHQAPKINGLKKAARILLGLDMIELHQALGISKVRLRKDRKNFSDLPLDENTLAYSCADSDITLRLFNNAKDRGALSNEYKVLRELDHKLIEVAMEMEMNGIRIDQEQLAILKDKVDNALIELKQSCENEIRREINLSSPLQLRKYLFEDLGLPVIRNTPKGAPTTDNGTLQLLGRKYGKKYPILMWLDEYRHLQMREKSFLRPLAKGVSPTTSRIYPNYHVARLVTGRLSATGDGFRLKRFNIQALPKLPRNHPQNVRSAFVASPGYTWVSFDLANIEMRIIANFSGDKGLIEELNKPTGDLHRLTCQKLFNKTPQNKKYDQFKQVSKIINFTLAYAFGINRLQEHLDLKGDMKLSRTKCWEIYDSFFKDAYPQWGEYKERIIYEARKTGYVTTLFGRKRNLSEYYAKADYKGCPGDRRAVNHPIQGSCADLMRMALVRIHQWIVGESLQGKVRMLSTIHDEVNFEIKGNPGGKKFLLYCRKIRDIMEWTPEEWKVPVVVTTDIGRSWGEMERYNYGDGTDNPPWSSD